MQQIYDWFNSPNPRTTAPRTLLTRFERYIEAVNLEAGYRMDLVQAHLDSGLDQVAQALLASGVLGAKDHQVMCHELERVAHR